jgi:tetratricopeptide (TPR) repeat protein
MLSGMRRSIALLVVTCISACSSPQHARTDAPRGVSAKAGGADGGADDDTRSSTSLAARLFAEKKYGEALVAYEQAYRLGHEPKALLGIADCQRALKHPAAAYDAYDSLLAHHEAQLTPEQKALVQDSIAALSSITGSLTLEISEADAEIDVDGRPWGRSPMPKPRRVRASTHTVHVAKPGFSTFEGEITIAPQEQKKVEVKLEADRSAGVQNMSEAERKAAARAAFAEGVKLQEQKDCVHAIARFETAERLHDAPTHLLHLAQCQAAIGKLLEAMETLATLDHLTLTAQAPDAFREAQEAGRAELPKLKPRVPMLKLQTIPPAATLKGLIVVVNGIRLPADLLGISRPVNPGAYHVTVTQAGTPRTANVEFELKEAETKSVDLKLSKPP